MAATLSVNGLYQYDNTLFNGLQIPSQMNKNVLINYIIMECAELEILIPDPDTLKPMIESWSISRLHSWERLYESTVQQYNMIHNYDRYEDWTDKGDGTGRSSANMRKAGYNSGNLVDSDANSGTTQTLTNSEHNGHLYGNIGVTTAAQMIQGERDIQAYDVYMAITDEFKRKFCAVVY